MARQVAVVMAAGKGTRMKSELPKVLIPVLGRPMVRYVVDALRAGGIERIVVIVGYRGELVRQELQNEPGVEFAEQREQLGTGHAVMMSREALAQHQGPVLVVAGDSPMLQRDSVARLMAEYEHGHPACILGTGYKSDPRGLGRIVRDERRQFLRIVEERDASEAERAITEVNLSCYVFDGRELFGALDQLKPQNAQGEYYLTDCPGLLLAAGKEVRALDVLKPVESLSINTPDELAVVEAALREQK
ncbi:MAG: NTP transferase domain-containing protein [Pirellulales bacterium]|nr:NTP transferase domain-containing protein [Pirellulales bacterium]